MRVNAIQCDACGSTHDIGDKSFVTVKGNIYLGIDGGLVGNNLEEMTTTKGDTAEAVAKENHFCLQCFDDLIPDHGD